MRKYCLLTLLTVLAVAGFSLSFFVSAAIPSDYGLKEGDLISAIFSDDPDVYIINEHGYKRLFLNPEIFKFYGHLGGFANVKLITPEIRDVFPTVGLFRNCEKNDPKVYGFESDDEDKGKLRWIDTSGEQAVKDDPSFFKKVFCINDKEFKWYPRGDELKSVKEASQYHRVVIPVIPAIPAVPTESAAPAIPVIPIIPASSSQPLISPTTTPKPASVSFSPTPVPVVQPATSAIPAIPIQQITTSSPTPTPTTTASSSFSPTPTPTTDTAEPSPPSLSVAAVSSSEIRVSWSASTDNVGVVGYKIYRNGYLIATVGAGTLSYSDTGLSSNTSYPYTVQAYDAAGNNSMMTFVSTQSATTFSATPTPTPTPTSSALNSPSSVIASLGAGKISVVWSGGTASVYKVFRCAASFGCGAGPAYSILSVTSNTYYDDYSVLDPGIVYRYKIYSCESNQTTCAAAIESNDVTYSTSTLNPILKIADTSKIIFPRDLFFGSSGSDVKQLQALLANEVGYSVDLITGYFGSITRDAVKRLQEKYSIKPVSGYFGEITRRTLLALISD